MCEHTHTYTHTHNCRDSMPGQQSEAQAMSNRIYFFFCSCGLHTEQRIHTHGKYLHTSVYR